MAALTLRSVRVAAGYRAVCSSLFARRQIPKVPWTASDCGRRFLLSEEYLGLKIFQNRIFLLNNFSIDKRKFMNSIDDKIAKDELILKSELLTLLHSCETEEDVQHLCRTVRRYHKSHAGSNQEFNFGSVLMRLFYIKGLHKEALDLIMDPELESFFNFQSYHILVDLLFENESYEDARNVISLMENRGWKLSFITNVLESAIYYKLNTPEAYESCLTLMKKILQEKEKPSRRMVSLAIALALQQNDMEKARTLFDSVDNKNTTLCFNLQLLMQSKLGNFDEVLTQLAALVLQETGRKFMKRVSSEVLTAVHLLMSNNEMTCQRLDQVYQSLIKAKLITHTSLDSLLLSSFPRKHVESEVTKLQRDRFHNVKAELVAD